MSTQTQKTKATIAAAIRSRRRAEGLTAMEAILHRDEIASLDRIKQQLGLASRSEVLRVLIAKTDPGALTQADADVLAKSAS